MKALKFFSLILLLAALNFLSQCTQSAPEDDAEKIDSVYLNGKSVPAIKYRTSLKFFEMSISRTSIDELTKDSTFGSLYFVVSHNNVTKPRYTRLIAYALDTLGDFMKGPDGSIRRVPIDVKPGSKPIIFEKNSTLEIGNMYLAASYLRKLTTRTANYKALYFTPQVSSPLSYEISTDLMKLTDCTLHPSPPAKPGTSSCQ